jgi:hypothetical protein
VGPTQPAPAQPAPPKPIRPQQQSCCVPPPPLGSVCVLPPRPRGLLIKGRRPSRQHPALPRRSRSAATMQEIESASSTAATRFAIVSTDWSAVGAYRGHIASASPSWSRRAASRRRRSAGVLPPREAATDHRGRPPPAGFRPLPLLSSASEHSILVPSVSSSFFPRRPSS